MTDPQHLDSDSTSARPPRPVSRRTVLKATAAGALVIPAGVATACGTADEARSPGTRRDRPMLTHGVAAGGITASGALIWARSNTPARMIVETAATESFANPRRFTGPQVTPRSDGTGRMRIAGLEPGRQVHYRVTMEGENGAQSEPVTGVLVTAPTAPQDIRFVWSGDVVGQGWGINPDMGGMTIFGAMADKHPDFFIHSGDAIYADGPVAPTQKQNDGKIYRSQTAAAKDQPAQTLDQFRGNYAYNLTDSHYRRFNSTVAQIVQWDDHEVINNWFPGENLAGQEREGYTEMNVDALAGRARQAWTEWQPVELGDRNRLYRKVSYGPLLDVFVLDMRTFKDPNPNAWAASNDAGILGEEQTAWLIDELGRSTATWKVIANDLPISIVVPDKATREPGRRPSMEAIAQGDDARPLGREIAFSRILSATKDVTGMVFLTADVHYTAAISYSPDRAGFTDFAPFWEFVSGPLHAGAFPTSPLDGTFGARYEFVHAPTEADTSPAEGFQHFGEVTIGKDERTMTVDLCDASGKSLYRKVLQPT
ncbi:alkaline phosphatase D family protein [Gordonia zhaorongruii]|uniref:alkaline phosphatase D family protein n=1 Tax=Gordonia zhaorongruii TaxID=2597659 RepID=UPI001043082C|nr:alkaline phosphatase D family protein [Gordonia zhaorongruii]